MFGCIYDGMEWFGHLGIGWGDTVETACIAKAIFRRKIDLPVERAGVDTCTQV